MMDSMGEKKGEDEMENIIKGFELHGVIPNRVETYHDVNTCELVATITPIHADKYEVKISKMSFTTPTMERAELLVQSYLKRRALYESYPTYQASLKLPPWNVK